MEAFKVRSDAVVLLRCAVLLGAALGGVACTPTPRIPAQLDHDAVVRALQEVDAPECYFLPPADTIRFFVEFSADGSVAAVRSDSAGPAVDCIAAHLRKVRIPPFPEGATITVEQPHAYDLTTDERAAFSRLAILEAIARADLSECAESAGPRRGEAAILTDPDGGLRRVFVRGASAERPADGPLAKCIERLMLRVRTPHYNGGATWLLVPYVVPTPRR